MPVRMPTCPASGCSRRACPCPPPLPASKRRSMPPPLLTGRHQEGALHPGLSSVLLQGRAQGGAGPLLGLGVNLRGDVHGLLRGVVVAGALKHLEVQADVAAQAALGQHALHRALNDALGQARLQVLEGLHAVRARPPVHVVEVGLVGELVAAHHHLVGVDHHHVAAHVHGGRVGGLLLAPDDRGSQGSQTAQGLALSIDDVPLLADVSGISASGVVRGVQQVTLELGDLGGSSGLAHHS
mmetsp:Transcript_250/g.580  ORF Transcript_250/g.580 Transcript_250/m.580 type:complete len:240 (-) Transcript_250:194-913(-)